MVAITIDLRDNPIFAPIISHCDERVDYISKVTPHDVTRRPDFVEPFSYAVFSGLQSGEYNWGIVSRFIKKQVVKAYANTMDVVDRKIISMAKHSLGDIFDSSFGLGKEFYDARKSGSNLIAMESIAPEVSRYFIALVSEGLELNVRDYEKNAELIVDRYNKGDFRLRWNARKT